MKHKVPQVIRVTGQQRLYGLGDCKTSVLKITTNTSDVDEWRENKIFKFSAEGNVMID